MQFPPVHRLLSIFVFIFFDHFSFTIYFISTIIIHKTKNHPIVILTFTEDQDIAFPTLFLFHHIDSFSYPLWCLLLFLSQFFKIIFPWYLSSKRITAIAFWHCFWNMHWRIRDIANDHQYWGQMENMKLNCIVINDDDDSECLQWIQKIFNNSLNLVTSSSPLPSLKNVISKIQVFFEERNSFFFIVFNFFWFNIFFFVH